MATRLAALGLGLAWAFLGIGCAGVDPYEPPPGPRVVSDRPATGNGQYAAGPSANTPPPPPAAGTGQAAPADADDVPTLAGRVAFIQGGVEIWDLQTNGWRAAVLNETVGPRSALRTGDDGRAEVTVGTSAFRLDSGTEIAWQDLGEERAVVDLQRGSLIVSRRREMVRPAQGVVVPPDEADRAGAETGIVPAAVMVDAVAVVLDGAGSTRLVADPGSRRLTVVASSGTAQVEHRGARTVVDSGQARVFDTTAGGARETASAQSTAFDRWSFDRDRRLSGSSSYRYVSPAMTGVEALDEHGRWQVDQSYGPIWYPTTVAPGWAPYRSGQWTWVPPWGWTWVDEAPWGYAPFHYGRWALVGNRWGWVPGTWVARPAYSPALVGFYGGGASVTIGSQPGIGWFPLAPYEPWYPAYRYTPRYFSSVNPHTRYRQGRGPDYPYRADQPARYRYSDAPAAATLVDVPRFTTGRPVRNRLPASADELRLLPTPGRGAFLPPPPNATVAPGRGAPRYERYPGYPGYPGTGSGPAAMPSPGPAMPGISPIDRMPRPGSDDRDRPIYQPRPPATGLPPAAAPLRPPDPRRVQPGDVQPNLGTPQGPPGTPAWGLFPRPGSEDSDRPLIPPRQVAPPAQVAPPISPAIPQPRMAPMPQPMPQPRMAPPPMSPPPMRSPQPRPGGLQPGPPTPGAAQLDEAATTA